MCIRDSTNAPVVIEEADVQPYGMTKSVRIHGGTIWASDSPHEIHMQISQPATHGIRRIFVGVLGDAAAERPKGEQLADVFLQDEHAPPLPANEPVSEIIAPSLKELKNITREQQKLILKNPGHRTILQSATIILRLKEIPKMSKEPYRVPSHYWKSQEKREVVNILLRMKH